jgi:hypothetical protein
MPVAPPARIVFTRSRPPPPKTTPRARASVREAGELWRSSIDVAFGAAAKASSPTAPDDDGVREVAAFIMVDDLQHSNIQIEHTFYNGSVVDNNYGTQSSGSQLLIYCLNKYAVGSRHTACNCASAF